VVVEANADDESVNLQYGPTATSIESPAGEPSEFWDRFKVAFDRHADEVFADQFRTLNAWNWTIKFADRDSDRLRERGTDAARHAMSKSVVYSLREAAIELPIMIWLKERQGFLADLLVNSVGNVEEEAVSPLDASYGLVQRLWWRRLAEDSGMRYGIRPFRTDPYAFWSLGIRDGERVFLFANVRYYYRLFADHRFEIALSLPLTHGFAIDIGTSYDFGRYGDERRLAIKLFKELKTGGIVHIGLEAKERPALLAGITFPL